VPSSSFIVDGKEGTEMRNPTRMARLAGMLAASAAIGAAVVALPGSANAAGVSATQVSADSFTNSPAEHQTEVEPDTYANGSTIVSVFQVGRYADGGADDIGWATSTDGGTTWQSGLLQGITRTEGNGAFSRVSDPAVVYDARAATWLASGLVITDSNGVAGVGVSVSRSPDGVNWSAQPVVAYQLPNTEFLDKDWITCDNTASSPYYGNCYIEADRYDLNDEITMITSSDGGKTWSAPQTPKGTPLGLGGEPVVQPGGTVVVPYLSNGRAIEAYRSTDGGALWRSSVVVAQATSFADPGLRTSPLPSVGIDSAGKVYVAWEDCRFRTNCSSNDIVLSSSLDGVTWSAVTRVPIDSVSSGRDHFNPGLAVDRTMSGSSTRLGIYYYFLPNASCVSATCKIKIGFISSANAGATWTSAVTVAGPMYESELAQAGGAFVGDYLASDYSGGKDLSVFAVGTPVTAGTLHEGMWSVSGGL
jgi:hypothetical protein